MRVKDFYRRTTWFRWLVVVLVLAVAAYAGGLLHKHVKTRIGPTDGGRSGSQAHSVHGALERDRSRTQRHDDGGGRNYLRRSLGRVENDAIPPPPDDPNWMSSPSRTKICGLSEMIDALLVRRIVAASTASRPLMGCLRQST